MKHLILLFSLFLSGCLLLDPAAEVGQTLHYMNQAYMDKELDAFMSFVSPDYQGRDNLQIAVENDFAGFADVEYRTSVFQTKVNKETGDYQASVYYFRTARSNRYGVDNQSGETVLTFHKDKDGLKLTKMPEPPLYGLIVP
ncbi:MAG: hypothetical protein J5787_05320 [Alphaproteobacteria bacterium]|nr:hypothetical protein [Alphaproteobacteria bacterium]